MSIVNPALRWPKTFVYRVQIRVVFAYRSETDVMIGMFVFATKNKLRTTALFH